MLLIIIFLVASDSVLVNTVFTPSEVWPVITLGLLSHSALHLSGSICYCVYSRPIKYSQCIVFWLRIACFVRFLIAPCLLSLETNT